MNKIILTILFSAAFLISGFSQGIKLSLQLPEGYRFTTETSVNLIVEQEFMGIRYNTQMEIATVLHLQVNGMDSDTSYVLSASYQKMDIRVSSILINMEVSTEWKNSQDSLSSVLRSMLGKEFSILLSDKGEAIDILGLDEMIDQTVSESSLPEVQKLEFSRNLIQSVGKDAVLDNYRNNSSFYPASAIKARDQWDSRMNFLKSGIPMELNAHIKVKELTRESAVLASEGQINSQTANREVGVSLESNQTFKLSGNEVSEKIIDLKTGLILESIVSQNISGTIRSPSENSGEEELVIPFKIISRCTMLSGPSE